MISGSGDGRILIAAAKKYGVRGVGFRRSIPVPVKLACEKRAAGTAWKNWWRSANRIF